MARAPVSEEGILMERQPGARGESPSGEKAAPIKHHYILGISQIREQIKTKENARSLAAREGSC